MSLPLSHTQDNVKATMKAIRAHGMCIGPIVTPSQVPALNEFLRGVAENVTTEGSPNSVRDMLRVRLSLTCLGQFVSTCCITPVSSASARKQSWKFSAAADVSRLPDAAATTEHRSQNGCTRRIGPRHFGGRSGAAFDEGDRDAHRSSSPGALRRHLPPVFAVAREAAAGFETSVSFGFCFLPFHRLQTQNCRRSQLTTLSSS